MALISKWPLRELCASIILKQHASYFKELKVHDFFKPVSRAAASSSESPELATAPTSGANVQH